MRKLIVTAGGTIESIDRVRKIANTSTGALGTKIVEAAIEYFEARKEAYQIYFVCTTTSKRPVLKMKDTSVIIVEGQNVSSIQRLLEDILTTDIIECCIHTMAVSDFSVGYGITLKDLATELTEGLMTMKHELNNDLVHDSKKRQAMYDYIESTLLSPINSLNQEEKFSSKEEIILGLKMTPKLISRIKEISPQTKLVGFKLLNQVSEKKLVEVANHLAKDNRCDYVLANDLAQITETCHPGILIKNTEIIGRYTTKDEIAKGIIDAVL